MAKSNAQKQADYRAKKKAEKAAATTATQTPGSVVQTAGPVALPGGGDDDALQVDVKVDETQQPKQSLYDRTMAKLRGQQPATPATAKPKARGGRAKKSDDNLLLTTLPTVIASLVATYSQNFFSDEYKACAPTKEEVTGIIGPLMEILAEQVEVVGKASANTIRLMNSLLAGLMYGARAYVTYTDIKKGINPVEKEHLRRAEYREKLEREAREYNDVVNEPVSLAGGLRAYQTAANGSPGDVTSNVSISAYAPSVKDDAERNNSDTEDGDSERKRSEAALVSNLFRRDIAGRKQLGLLPSAV